MPPPWSPIKPRKQRMAKDCEGVTLNPPNNIKDFSDKDIEALDKYATYVKQRDFSDSTKQLAARAAKLVDSIRKDDGSDREASLEMWEFAYATEVALWSRASYRPFFSDTEKTVYKCLSRITRARLHADYGDELAVFVDLTKLTAKEKKTENWRKLQTSVVAIEQALQEEAPQYERFGRDETVKSQHVATSIALQSAARKLGFDYRDAREIFSEYSERNSQFHSGIKDLLAEKHWAKLAQRLYDNVHRIPLLELNPQQGKAFMNVTKQLIKMFFDEISDEDKDYPEAWPVKRDALQNAYKLLKQPSESKDTLKRQLQEAEERIEALEEAEKRIQRIEAEQGHMISELQAELGKTQAEIRRLKHAYAQAAGNPFTEVLHHAELARTIPVRQAESKRVASRDATELSKHEGSPLKKYAGLIEEVKFAIGGGLSKEDKENLADLASAEEDNNE